MKSVRMSWLDRLLITTICLGAGGLSVATQPRRPMPVANVIEVTNLDNHGPGSLREAIQEANGDHTPSTIVFDRSLWGGSIAVLWALPFLSESYTTIDGDIDGDRLPDIELNGDAQTWALLGIAGSHNLVRGLVVNRSSGPGILISGGTHNRIEYCYVGVDFSGTQNLGNYQSGIALWDGASDNQIGPGNVVAYNAQFGGPDGGIAVLDGLMAEHFPEFVGLEPDYVGSFPVMDFPGTGGPFTSADGITPTDEQGRPFGDTFGARFTGSLNVKETGTYTVSILHPDDVLQVLIDDVLVAEAGCMTPAGCQDYTTTTSLSAGSHDIRLNFLDGPGAAGFALQMSGPGDTGLTHDGAAGLWGEFFRLRIPSERNRITRNSIFSNGRIGIEVDALEGPWSVNFMDPADDDIGPNTALNYPVLDSAVLHPGRLIVRGWIDTRNPHPLILEFFANPVPVPGADPSGYGEGAIYLGSARASAINTFTAALPAVEPGTLITGTVTDGLGNTSEFSMAIPAIPKK